MRYSIMVRYPGQNQDVELCRCDVKPNEIANFLRAKTTGRARIAVYEYVGVVDNERVKTV